MRLRAGCDLTLEAAADSPMVAMLRPRSGLGQWVVSEKYLHEPCVPVVEYVDAYGNLCQRMVVPKGSAHIRVEVVVESADEIAVARDAPRVPIEDLPDAALQFLLGSRYCPSDMLVDLASDVTARCQPGYAQVEAIRAYVRDNIAYRYGVSTASTDARDTLRDRAGVCRDFAHVGMSLTRALGIPARMVVGWLHGLEPMDLHAWFEAFVGGRWYTFDATQPEPRGGRIVVAYGRDAADVALITEYGPLETRAMKVWVERA
ncbi:MAG: transglutaminase family protein [Polyangiales bacterium]